MKDQVLLPISKSPLMSYNHQAAFLGILFRLENFYKYFYSDFINLWYAPQKNTFNFDLEKWYDDNSLFDVFMLTAADGNVLSDCFGETGNEEVQPILQEHNLIRSFQTLLKSGFYAYGRINEYFVPNRMATKTAYYVHDFFLNGYDTAAGTFSLSGYSKNLRFETDSILFEEFARALTSLEGRHMLTFVRLKDSYDFQIDLGKILLLLEDYLNARHSYPDRLLHNPTKTISRDLLFFGAGVSGALIENCRSTGEEEVDLRLFRTLLEQKQCMLKRLSVLEEAGVFLGDNEKNEWEILVKEQAILFNMAIKYNLTRDRRKKLEICQMLRKVQERDLRGFEQAAKGIRNALDISWKIH